jgi:hypothetical protein
MKYSLILAKFLAASAISAPTKHKSVILEN